MLPWALLIASLRISGEKAEATMLVLIFLLKRQQIQGWADLYLSGAHFSLAKFNLLEMKRKLTFLFPLS